MGNALLDNLKKAKGLLKLIAAVFCLVGAISVTSMTGEFIYVTQSQLVVFSLALAGGCLVALALLVSYLESENRVAVLILDFLYAVFNFITGCLAGMNLRDYGVERNGFAVIVPLSALVAGVLFIVDFIREVRSM